MGYNTGYKISSEVFFMNIEDERFLRNFALAILLTIVSLVISLDIAYIMEYIL